MSHFALDCLGLVLCIFLMLMGTVLWEPLSYACRNLPGGEFNPPWANWVRMFGVAVGAVGLVIFTLFWGVW